eukprot:1663425-Ditylum_brightwellii.AAC.1
MPHLSSSIGFSPPMLGFASHMYLPVRAHAHSALFRLLTRLNPYWDSALLSPGRALAHTLVQTWL